LYNFINFDANQILRCLKRVIKIVTKENLIFFDNMHRKLSKKNKNANIIT